MFTRGNARQTSSKGKASKNALKIARIVKENNEKPILAIQ